MNFLHNFNIRESNRESSMLDKMIRKYTGCSEPNLLRNFRKMCQMCDSISKISSKALSLVAERFRLGECRRHVPPASSSKISDDIKSKVRKTLLEHSNGYSVTIESGNLIHPRDLQTSLK
ncbi:hypothetical protein BB560_005121, partial [Smittium megazygosporum]